MAHSLPSAVARAIDVPRQERLHAIEIRQFCHLRARRLAQLGTSCRSAADSTGLYAVRADREPRSTADAAVVARAACA
jgi:hypothetical protein